VVIVLHRLAVVGSIDASTLSERRVHVVRWVDRLLGASLERAGEVRIGHRLSKQREHFLGCLYDLSTERSLRPSVISRKISCGNDFVDDLAAHIPRQAANTG